MTLKKTLFIKGFIIVDKIHELLLYQRFKALFFKKYLSDDMKLFYGELLTNFCLRGVF